MTPNRRRLNQRLEHARLPLVHSSASIDEIAVRFGYADRFHFPKAFKKFYAQPPAAHRAANGPGGQAGW